MTFKEFFGLVPATWAAFSEDKAPRLAASLSYFTVFSIAPMLVIAIGIAGLFFDSATAQKEIEEQLKQVLSPTAAEGVHELLVNAFKQDESRPLLATIVGIALALFGASGLFGALQDSLNTIWGVAPRPDLGIMGVLRARFLSFAMVLGVGFVMLVSLVLAAVLSILTTQMGSLFGETVIIAQIFNVVVGFLVTMLLFAAMFKVLPDAEIQWRDVWVGAAVTALLFSVGRFALAWYLSRPGTASAYGSAGALVVLLIWVNYASQILFFGAEFTKVYANKFGSKIVPSEHAIPVTAEARARQGLSPKQSAPAVAGAGRDVSNKVDIAQNRQLTREQMENARKDFEFTLATVAGALVAVAWFWRKRH